MLPKRISGETRELAKNQDEYGTLHIRDRTDENGQPIMESAWEPTPDELERIIRGAAIHLHIMGRCFPPVMLTVGEAPE